MRVIADVPAVGSPCRLAGQGSGDFLDVIGEWFRCAEFTGIFAPCERCLLMQGRVWRHLGQVLERVGQGGRVAEEAEGGAGVRRQFVVQCKGEA